MSKKSIYTLPVLEKIARVIGDYFTGTEIQKLLHASGIPKAWIEYPNTKWWVVNNVFEHCKKNKNGDKKITSAILIFTHPLNHKDEESACDIFRSEIKKYLNYENLSLICNPDGRCKIESKHLEKLENPQLKTKKKDGGNKKPAPLKDITFWERYRDDYRQFMQVIEIFLGDKESVTDELNYAYRTLRERITKEKEIFSPYIPFNSLFSAEKEWEKHIEENLLERRTIFEWNAFRPSLQETYSKILEKIEEARKEKGSNDTLSTDQISVIIGKYPTIKESKEFIQKMEVTHKFEKRDSSEKSPLSLDTFKKIRFENENLYFDTNRIPLVKHSHGKQIAAFMMEKSPHEKIDWSEIYENTLGDDSQIDLPKKNMCWRKIRDASEEINKKIISKIGLKSNEKFIDWDQNCFWRTV